MKERSSYLKLVEWSEEDQCFIGSALPLIGPCCHGKDEAKVYRELCTIVDEWITLHRKDGRELPEPALPPGKKFSGRFLVRIDPKLHKFLALRSLRSGKSLNAYVEERLSEIG